MDAGSRAAARLSKALAMGSGSRAYAAASAGLTCDYAKWMEFQGSILRLTIAWFGAECCRLPVRSDHRFRQRVALALGAAPSANPYQFPTSRVAASKGYHADRLEALRSRYWATLSRLPHSDMVHQRRRLFLPTS